MRFGLLTIIAILSYAGAATAFPRLNKQAVEQKDCVAQKAVFTSNTDDFSAVMNEMRHLAAVSQKDTSAPLRQFRPTTLPPFTPAEESQLAKTVGRCSCLYDGKKLEGDSSADCFVGGVSGKNQTVVGIGHLIRDFMTSQGKPMPGKLNCEFANNFGDPAIPLVFENGTYKMGTMDREDKGADSLVVRLKRPIQGAEELPILVAGYDLKPGTKFYAVSAGLQETVRTKDLVAQECGVIVSDNRQFFNDCTSIKGQTSGMVNIVRDQDGRMAAIGVTQGSSGREKDGQPAVTRNSDGKLVPNNVTRSLVLNEKIVRDVLSVESQSGQKMVQKEGILPGATQGL